MYTLNNLKRRSSRTGLTVAGITLAIALMVVMFSIGNGVRDSASALLEETGVDIFCQANGTGPQFFFGDISDGRNISRRMMEENDNIRSAFPMMIHSMYAINETTRQRILSFDPGGGENLSDLKKDLDLESVTMNGIIPEYEGRFGGIDVLEGDGFSREDDPFFANGTYAGGVTSPNFTHEMQVNKVLSDKLRIGVGDRVYVNNQLPSNISDLDGWLRNATSFQVKVVVKASWEGLGTASAYVHLSELQYIAGKRNDTIHQILVDLEDPTRDDREKKWIEENFPQLEASTVEDFLGEIEETTAVFRGFGEMILLVTGIIAVMFTATVMIIAVRERIGEIAALRALGISRLSVFGSILLETFIIIMVGFLFGFLIGIPLALALDQYLIGLSSGGGLPQGFHFVSFTPLLLLQMGAVALLFGLVSGLIPAIWASRLNIAETLKKE